MTLVSILFPLNLYAFFCGSFGFYYSFRVYKFGGLFIIYWVGTVILSIIRSNHYNLVNIDMDDSVLTTLLSCFA